MSTALDYYDPKDNPDSEYIRKMEEKARKGIYTTWDSMKYVFLDEGEKHS